MSRRPSARAELRQREREFKRRYAEPRRHTRRWLPYAFFTAAAITAGGHLGRHAFASTPTGLEDLLVGYPTALVLAVIGGVLLPVAGRR